ncbi:DUF2946 family protein [Caulobacter segnis]|uniref:DUF2946 domain-containing protein n=1 Tax=Caulobacter segnis TaxID=88688 RepID=A0A2W5WQ01_9CAUL|nr:DUF2946 family protein [Caulobacter segnis]PZR36168.1 MAG: DUF2946 domain-containing protein [Caulobacter segnis]
MEKAAHKPLWTDLAMAFALVAVCLRVLIPSGYMPVFSANGAPTMVICTGAGPKLVTVRGGLSVDREAAEGEQHEDHPHTSKSDCGFGGLAQAAPSVEPRLTLAPAALVAAARLGPLAGRDLTLPLRARPPPQTGPPIQA